EETARDKLAHLLACDYAERVLGLFETAYPDDKRPRQAIETAKLYANGQATTDALDAARAAARAAAGGAARAAERKWQGRRLMKYLEAVR
ncbi:MAG: hypothetical protein Q8Q08_10420, partial [Candidatus Omnitrophota bacterium]|nr:hypothetical protein [Candidatus Omnitrophota bacterium]